MATAASTSITPSPKPKQTLTHFQEVISCDGLIDKLLHRFGHSKLSVRKVLDVVNSVFSILITEEYVLGRIEKIKAYQQQLQKLLQIPKIDQRTEEWYAMRQKMITASDFAQALGKSKYGTPKQQLKEFYAKKCGYEDMSTNAFTGTALKWGTMYEAIALKLYQKRTGYMLHEFGLLPHPTVDYFGASPDAINEYGIMVEIKCPLTREINGTYPVQYYFQMQGQMDVCGLQECDFVECQLTEFNSADAFWESYDTCTYERGIVVEFKSSEASPKYMYSDVGLAKDVLQSWLQCVTVEHGGDNIIPHYWQVELLNTIRVYHDPQFMQSHLSELGEVWEKVKAYRVNKDEYMKEVGPMSKKMDMASGFIEFKGYCMLDD